MNHTIPYDTSDLAHPALQATHASARPALSTNYRLRQIAGDVAMVVAVLAFVLTFIALRFTLLASPDIVERFAIPVATGAGVVCVLALLGSFALRYGVAPNR